MTTIIRGCILHSNVMLPGEFGVVYRGLLFPEIQSDAVQPESVAVKTLKGEILMCACILSVTYLPACMCIMYNV